MANKEESVNRTRGSLPAGIRFHSGHTWIRRVSVNLAFVGPTEFAINFAGSLTDLSLPTDFKPLKAGDTAWTFIAKNGRVLDQVSPIGGDVLVVNSDILDDLGGLRRSPYDDGWLLCLRSPSISEKTEGLLSQEPDRLWLDQTFRSMEAVLDLPSRVPYRDARWRPEFGDEFSDREWEALRKSLFPACTRRTLPTVSWS